MEEKIESLIDEYFDNSEFYKVGFSLSSKNKGSAKVKVTIDGDRTITLDDCTQINRDLYKKINESGLLENYELEVTSAGIGEPLKLKRQYYKNKGRNLSFYLEDGKTRKGKLKEVKEDSVIIETEQSKKGNKKKKSGETTETELFFDQIVKAKVEVSFS